MAHGWSHPGWCPDVTSGHVFGTACPAKKYGEDMHHRAFRRGFDEVVQLEGHRVVLWQVARLAVVLP